MHIVNIVTAL